MADVKGLLADPEFQQLDTATQKTALGRVDSAFANLSDDDFHAFRQHVQPPVPGMEKLGGTAPSAPRVALPPALSGTPSPGPTSRRPTNQEALGAPAKGFNALLYGGGYSGRSRTSAPADEYRDPSAKIPVISDMAEGPSDVLYGAAQAGGDISPTEKSKGMTRGRAVLGGGARVIDGAMKVGSAMLPEAMATAPARTAKAVLVGTVNSKLTHAGLKAAGADDETSDFASGLTGLLSGGLSGRKGALTRGTDAPTPTTKLSGPDLKLFQGLRPASANYNFESSLQEARPLLEAAQSTAGTPAPPNPSNTTPATGIQRPMARPIQGLDDLIGAAKTAKKKIRSQLDLMKPEGIKVSGDDVANRILGTISSRMEQTDPAQVQAVKQFAESYRGKQFTLDQLEDHLTEANAELNGFYRRSPHGQQVSATANLNTASVKAEAEALRESLYAGMDQYGDGTLPRQLQHQYGSLIEVLTAAQNRKNVALRQVPQPLADQAANLAASGESLTAISAALSGHPLIAAGVVANAGARKAMAAWIKDNNSTDGLIRRAFEGTATTEPWSRPKGLIEAGSIKPTPPPDTSGGGMQPLAPHQQVNRMYKALPAGSPLFTQGTSVPDIRGTWERGTAKLGEQKALPAGTAPFTQGTVVPDILGRPNSLSKYLLPAPAAPGPTGTTILPMANDTLPLDVNRMDYPSGKIGAGAPPQKPSPPVDWRRAKPPTLYQGKQ